MIDLASSSLTAPLTPIGAIFAGVGLVLFLAGAGMMLGGQRFRRRGQVVQGTIVDLVATDPAAAGHRTGVSAAGMGMADMNLIYEPTLEFTTQAGREVRVTSRFGSDPAPGRVGDRVRVIYDPHDPQRARIDSARGGGTCLAVAFMLIGAPFVALGVILLKAA